MISKAYIYKLAILLWYMAKKQGEKFIVGEVKSGILEFILENTVPVKESAVREHLHKKYDVVDQGSINRHMSGLKKLDCIESVSPVEKSRSNYWDIKNLKNLRNIKHEFPAIKLNTFEKSIKIILREHRYVVSSPDWLRLYIQLLMSPSFFDACIENSVDTLNRRIVKIYVTSIDSYREQRINDLLEVCYANYVRCPSVLETSEEKFTNSMRGLPWEVYVNLTEDMIPKNMQPHDFEKYFPGLPEEIPHLFLKTRLKNLEKIPVNIPVEINKGEIGKYALSVLSLIVNQKLDFRARKDVLLLEHFLNHDILIGTDSPEELYFVKKTKENHILPRGSTEPWRMNLKESELADLKLASEMIIKFKQPSEFNVSNNLTEVYQAVLNFYSIFQVPE